MINERVKQPQQLDNGTKARMVELGFDPEQIYTGEISDVMKEASVDVETEYGNVRAEVVAAFYAAGRGEEVTDWMMKQLFS